MKHSRFRLLHWTEARTPWVRAVRTWRQLLPDWTPSLDAQRDLENKPHEYRAAVAVLSDGWEAGDPRWDVLMALLEYERRDAAMRHQLKEEMASFSEVLPMPEDVDETYERMRSNSEVTVETPLSSITKEPLCTVEGCSWPDCNCAPEGRRILRLVPKPGTPKVFTVRTLASLREEMEDGSSEG